MTPRAKPPALKLMTTENEPVKPVHIANHDAQTLEDLLFRLLRPAETKNEVHFAPIFLAFYPFFCSPKSLIKAVIAHAKSMMVLTSPMVPRSGSVGRDLMIIDQWISAYPGDFALDPSRTILQKFIDKCANDDAYFIGADLMQSAVKNMVENDDTLWVATKPEERQRSGSEHHTRRLSASASIESNPSVGSTLHEDLAHLQTSFGEIENDATYLQWELAFDSEARSPTTQNDVGSLNDEALSSSQTLLNASESAQRQAALLIPDPSVPFTKTQWREFMDQPNVLIARELTRIDWIMFNAIRTRDLIRHVTLPKCQRSAYPSLENVDRVIKHFNHLACWVTNLILLRNKPKHRALALEKIMRVARELRKCNNYNSLGALVAGLQNSAVHRLSQTRALVPEYAQRDFMKLEVLMSTQKSHAAYRLAWDNTTGPRIPFLPLHRRDLVIAESGNATFVGSDDEDEDEDEEADEAPHINWKKFEIMGEIILDLQRARTTSYPEYAANEHVKSLILECVLVEDEDALYSRSVSLEGRHNSAGGRDRAMTRTLHWLSKDGDAE